MSYDIEKTTIMVVDDTPQNLKLLEKMLQDRGYRVVLFPNGDLALKAAEKRLPDLILLDINMPDIDGFEVCKRLKADEKLKNIPVIFITAMTDTADKVKAFNVGGVDYIAKPFQFEEVQARVETHLHLRNLQLKLYNQNQRLEEQVHEKVREISDSQMAAISALAQLAESRDEETGQHIERTQTYCTLLAKELQKSEKFKFNINENYIKTLSHTAPLHDIGKVGIPDKVLLKPGKLLPDEWEIMKTHANIGAQTMLAIRSKYPRNAFVNMGIDIARSHHEKWDGSGYPDGLKGENIPLSARLMALADVYDALRSTRPYKSAFSHEKAYKIIIEGAGKHFDPAVIEAFSAVESNFAEVFYRKYGRGVWGQA